MNLAAAVRQSLPWRGEWIGDRGINNTDYAQKATDFLSKYMRPQPSHDAYWWFLSCLPAYEHISRTPRIIALELCALIAEEEGL